MKLKFNGPKSLKVGDQTIDQIGAIFDNNDRDWSILIKRGVVEIVDGEIPVEKTVELGTEIPQDDYQIIEGKAGWLYVEKNGERIGSATRDREEAELIILEDQDA